MYIRELGLDTLFTDFRETAGLIDHTSHLTAHAQCAGLACIPGTDSIEKFPVSHGPGCLKGADYGTESGDWRAHTMCITIFFTLEILFNNNPHCNRITGLQVDIPRCKDPVIDGGHGLGIDNDLVAKESVSCKGVPAGMSGFN